MKNLLKVFGIIALAAVFGFPMISCGDDVAEVLGGVLTITNLGDYKGKYIVAWGNNDTLVALNLNKKSGEKVSDDGSAILSVWNVEGEGTPSFTPYKESDPLLLRVIVFETPQNVNFADGSDVGEGGWAVVAFQQGIGAGAFTDKIPVEIPTNKSGILTLTGLGNYEGKYVVAWADTDMLVAAKNVNAKAQTGKGVKIYKGKAVLNVWKAEGNDESSYAVKPYDGNDPAVLFSIIISDDRSVKFDKDSAGWALAAFQKGIGAGGFVLTKPVN
jgi:hypothetical protein